MYRRRSSTERATKPQGKTALARRVAALLACGFVARRVTERCGYAPLLAPRHKPKSPATNCILSHGLVSNTFLRHRLRHKVPAPAASVSTRAKRRLAQQGLGNDPRQDMITRVVEMQAIHSAAARW